MTFGTILKRLRWQRQRTQRSVALALEMDQGYYSRIENDRHDFPPSRVTITRMASVLELSPDEGDELLLAAGRMPEDLERALMERADLRALVRRKIGKAA